MRTVFILIAALAPAVGASAASLEAAAGEARLSFLGAAAVPAASLRAVEMPSLSGVPLNPVRAPYEAKSVAAAGSEAAPAAGPAAEAELGTLLDSHLRSKLALTLGGQRAFVSGVFDRQQNAFLSVWVDGQAAPVLFNIKGLLDKAGSVKAGSAEYTVYIEANPLKPLKSRIAFENKANDNDVQGVRLGELLDAIEGSGRLVQLTGQSYRLFYFHDVQEGASGVSLNPNSRTFALILKDGSDMHVFLIPEETVPADRLAVFKVYKDKKLGLQSQNGRLRVFEL